MNTIAEPVFGNIPLSLIRESSTNPRRHFDPIKLEELTASIRISGVGQPILVRPHPDQENNPDCVEIVAGARRFKASQLAGRETIPAIVRDMQDIEVLEFQLVENLQRADVHEIEEAEGYHRLMKEHKLKAEEVAEKVGKSRSYIFGRLKLLSLTEDVREKFFEGQIDASTALLIARIPVPALQVKAMTEIAAGGVHWSGILKSGPPMSYRQAKDHIRERFMLQLTEARFDIHCADLISACGNCTDCSKRTGNQPEIYSDVDADICTDPDCFAAKGEAHNEKVIATAKDLGAPVFEGEEAEDKFEGADYATLDDCFWSNDVKDEFHGEPIRDMLKADQLPAPVAYAKLDSGLEPLFDFDAMNDALKRAGILKSDEEIAQQKAADSGKQKKDDKAKKELLKQKEHMAAQHTMFNNEVYQAIKSAPLSVFHRPLLKLVLQFIFDRLGSHSLWKELGMECASNEEKLQHINSLDDGMLQLMVMDSVMISKIKTETWSVDDKLKVKDQDQLIRLAKECNIDVEAIRLKHMPVDVKTQSAKKPARPKNAKAKQQAEAAPTEPLSPPADTSTLIQLENVVRVKDDARGPNKKKRKVAGKIGVVMTEGDTFAVRFGPSSADLVDGMTRDELEKTEDQVKPDWWQKWKEKITAVWPFPTLKDRP